MTYCLIISAQYKHFFQKLFHIFPISQTFFNCDIRAKLSNFVLSFAQLSPSLFFYFFIWSNTLLFSHNLEYFSKTWYCSLFALGWALSKGLAWFLLQTNVYKDADCICFSFGAVHSTYCCRQHHQHFQSKLKDYFVYFSVNYIGGKFRKIWSFPN